MLNSEIVRWLADHSARPGRDGYEEQSRGACQFCKDSQTISFFVALPIGETLGIIVTLTRYRKRF